ncbi:uncharacterized protein METZ01_LOCUS160764 [marine metagenome]|uniref:Uncharacterized protein n=1 Tax=marine metagenome TaxID=408172 RepID=A0A382B259_9ZZZZ
MVDCDQLSPKHSECLSLVGMLTATTSTRDNSSSGEMDQANSTLRDILVLPALTTGAKHLNSTLCEEFNVRLWDRRPGISSVFSHRRPLDGTRFTVIFYSTVRRNVLDIESTTCL